MIEKLLYYEGDLSKADDWDNIKKIDAAKGYKANLASLKGYIYAKDSYSLITNNLALLGLSDLLWDRKTHRYNIMFFDNESGTWKDVEAFSYRNINNLSNLELMYKKGSFDKAKDTSKNGKIVLKKYAK